MLEPKGRSRAEAGASSAEYGLLMVGITALIVVFVFAFGGIVRSQFQSTCTSIKSSGTSGGTC
jgi:Flp pilus assembly pilin Flp